MAKKPMKKRPPPPPSMSSSSDEESPPPSISPVKKLSAASTAAVLRKQREPSLEPIGGEKEGVDGEEAEENEESIEDTGKATPKLSHRAAGRVSRNTDDDKPAATKTLTKTMTVNEKSNKNDKSSESEEEVSTDEESSEDSGDAARQPKPLTKPRDSKIANDRKQEVSNTSSSSDSGSGDENEDSKELKSRAESKQPQPSPLQAARESPNPIADPSLKPFNSSKSVNGEEEDDESEEEETTADDESSEDFCNTDPKVNPPPQPRDSQNVGDDKQPSNTSSSSGSGLRNDEEDIEAPISGPSLEPLSNMPIDSSAKPVEKKPNSVKQSAASSAKISKKKRTAGIVRVGGSQEKELFRRIWSNEDELVLLQSILEYKERHHVIPYTLVHTESLLKYVKDSLSISVSVNQLNDKVRRMKKRYKTTTSRQMLTKKSKISDPHNATVFDLSKKIWDSFNEESIFFADKIKLEKKEENLNKRKGGSKHFAGEHPSLYWFLRSEHADNALVLQNHIPIPNAKQFDEKCKKLEMMDIQLNMQKIEFLSSAVKLIKDALPESL